MIWWAWLPLKEFLQAVVEKHPTPQLLHAEWEKLQSAVLIQLLLMSEQTCLPLVRTLCMKVMLFLSMELQVRFI